MTKSRLAIVFGRGCSQKVRLALGALVGTSSTSFFTAADIAGHILNSEHPSASIDEFRSATMMVSNAITAMEKSTKSEIFRCKDKISPRNSYPAWSSTKAAVGFRIGACISTPVVNSDIMTERRNGKELAEALNKNPLEASRSILPILTDSQLTDLMMDILAIKDERMLNVRNDLANCRRDDNKAKSNAKLVLETALAQLANEV